MILINCNRFTAVYGVVYVLYNDNKEKKSN